MRADVAGCLAAVALFPLFLFIPGYAAAWALDLLAFRRRTTAFRIALSIPLAIALCPIITYLAGRFASMRVVWLIYAAAAVYFLSVLRRGRNRFTRDMLTFCAIAAVWLGVALYSLIDFQIGDRLYLPTSAIDHSLRSAVVHAISSTGVPPQNPFFWPGHGVKLRYHYFWFLMCSLVDQAGGALVSPRQALMAGTFWCGLGLMGLLAIYLRLAARQDCPLTRRLRIGLLLLGITGLDLIPAAFFMLLYAKGGINVFLPSVEWWNEHVDWFLYSSVWAPHALAATISCFLALLLLWKAAEPQERAGMLRHALAAGVALASGAGESIYVSFVFAVFLLLWTAVTVWKRCLRETSALVAAGITAVALSLPYLSDLSGPASGSGGGLFQFTVRSFTLAALVPFFKNSSEHVRLLFVNLPLEPVNYLLEFGFFFAAGCIWVQKRRRQQRPLSREELSCALLAGTSITICTFMKSVIGCNDLGWRGMLPAQFVLLLWGIELLARWRSEHYFSDNQKAVLGLFLILGAAGTMCDLVLVRLYPVMADAGKVPPLDWMGPDRQVGKRTYASRAAYEWVHQAIPETAVIQANPNVSFQETFSMYYADRRNVAADTGCLTAFGGDPAECPDVVRPIERIYAAADSLRKLCERIPADLLVAKDTDTVWANRNSWVWTERPLYANAYVRLFACKSEALNSDSRLSSIVLHNVGRPILPDSVGINRRGVANERVVRGRCSEPPRPRAM
jgi:hypothetical protein